MLLRILASAIVYFGFAMIADAQDASTLTISGAGDATHDFSVEVVNTPELIEQGLMGRTELAADAGMLFDYSEPQQIAMWMKDTPLPLDMLFLNASGKVVAIARNTVPNSERRITPGFAVRAVLELNGGTASALEIAPGAIVRHSLFGNVTDTSTAGE